MNWNNTKFLTLQVWKRFHKKKSMSFTLHCAYYRGVARGEAEGARAPLEFSRSVNPIQTGRGGGLCPSHYCQPRRIQKAIYISELQLCILNFWANSAWCVKRQNFAGLCQQTFYFSSADIQILQNSSLTKWFYQTELREIYLYFKLGSELCY